MLKKLQLLCLCMFLACNTNNKKETATTESAEPPKITQKEISKPLKSGDYSTLLTNYNCDVTISEIAAILKVPETDLSLSDTAGTKKCSFILKGFGESVISPGSHLTWSAVKTSKAQNKKEISSYLERKEDGLKIMGMDIELAETGDCYIAYQPAHGRVIIYNENYDHAFLLNYGIKSANNNRTKEQHDALKGKMTDLANYLLKKHRK